MSKLNFRGKTKNRGQSMVEFVLALPILLFVIFGVIEFARLTFAWMSVQNAARFGIRYAVTGEFNEVYCVAAGNNLGADHINADVFGGDPQDCIIPDSYPGIDSNEKERELIDLARLFSIQDAATGGGTGLWLEPGVFGDYEQYLSSNNPIFIGQVASKGYFHTTICSNRGNQFAVDYNNHAIPLCVDNLNLELMDDAGGPGDRVKIHIEHEHPFFLPLLENIWPSVSLTAERDGIVEKFRTSRVIGVSGPILSAPTWTQTPTITDTPTITLTPTETPSITPSITPSPTNTPIPVDCDLITVVNSFVGHWTSGYHIASVTIRNDNPVPIHLYTANQTWQKNDPGRYYWAAKFNNSSWDILNDTSPPTTWNPSPAIEMIAGGTGDYIGLFQPRYVVLEGDTTVDLVFDDGCHKGVTVMMPTSTPTDTPTVTPTPDCSNYSMSNFSIKNYAILSMTIRNHDAVDANLISLDFNWDFAEQYGAANGYNNLNVDWFKWAGAYMGDGQGGARDYSSHSVWNGSVPFNAGVDYRWEIDFDGDWSTGGIWPGIQGSDFGVVALFDNGCILDQDAVPHSVVTWTPTSTPTRTPTASPLPPPTITPLPSNTPLPTNTPLPSLTPSITPTPSDTPVPSHTSWPSNTPLPSWTPFPSSTSSPTSTNTPLPTSTFTPVYTSTQTPIPTWTPACPYDDYDWPCQPTWTPTP